jgi:hypothetical protein
MKAKIAFSYLTTASDGQVIVNVKSGLLGIAENVVVYATPVPPLAAVQTALDDFLISVASAAGGGIGETATKNAKRIALAALVRPLSNYVTDTAAGDLAKLMSSGLPIQKPGAAPVGPLSTPTTPVAAQGPITGSLSSTSSPVYGAGMYNWRLALASAPTTYLQTAQTMGARHTFKGLTPGQVYNVELNAVGAAGASDWSDDGSVMVL